MPQPRITRGVKFSITTSACATSSAQQLTAVGRRRDSSGERALAAVDDVEGSGAVPVVGVGIVLEERAEDRARLVEAMGRLDLDHLGAEVGEQPADVGRGEDVGEIEHPKPRERAVGRLDRSRAASLARRIRGGAAEHLGRVLAQTRGARADAHRREREVREHGGKLEPVEARAPCAARARSRSCGQASRSAAPRTSPQSSPSRRPRSKKASPSSAPRRAERSSTSSAAFAARPRRGREPRLGQARLAEQLREPLDGHLGCDLQRDEPVRGGERVAAAERAAERVAGRRPATLDRAHARVEGDSLRTSSLTPGTRGSPGRCARRRRSAAPRGGRRAKRRRR